MNESTSSRRFPFWFLATAAAIVLLGAYVGGYFGLGRYSLVPEGMHGFSWRSPVQHHRYFPGSVLTVAYYPLGWIECRFRGEQVLISQTHSSVGEESTGKLFTLP